MYNKYNFQSEESFLKAHKTLMNGLIAKFYRFFKKNP